MSTEIKLSVKKFIVYDAWTDEKLYQSPVFEEARKELAEWERARPSHSHKIELHAVVDK